MTVPLLRIDALRALEAEYAHLPPHDSLMQRAGAAAAGVARRLASADFSRAPAPVLVFAGPGNNGGDARVMARALRAAGVRTTVVDVTADGRVGEIPPGDYGLVVDGLFGIGLRRPLVGAHAALIARINAFPGPVLALDVPSGLDADTGRILGAGVRATHTASFLAGKPGLYTLDGPDHCGEIGIHALGVENIDPRPPAAGALLDTAEFAACLRPRARNSHKGSFGSLAVIGGAPGMGGAALLAARAGLYLGAGRVFVGIGVGLPEHAPEHAAEHAPGRPPLDPLHPELMLRAPAEALAQASAAVIGPGLGRSTAALDLLRRAASADFPLLLDADALNLLAEHPVLAEQFARRPVAAGPATVATSATATTTANAITPHPAEAARLLGTDVAAIQADRIGAALTLATRLNAVVALKGCGTVLAHPDGRWRINANGNPGLATGGSGDTLAGIAGALLAQGWPAWQALCCAVHLHGAAADALVAAGTGPLGLTAGELIPTARHLLNRWIALNV